MDKPAKKCDAARRPGDTDLASLGLDAFDYGFLCAARYFFVAFSGNPNAWIHAILNADAFFPHTQSADCMRAALAAVQDMRASRRSCFHFSNPSCPCCSVIVTPDERHLVQLFQHVRQGHTSRAASSAMLLCEGRDTSALITSMHALSAFAPGAKQSARTVLHS
ncbi:MAG: hypothetical protein AAFY38_11715 [Pseudomonadota bacterium]